MYHTTPPHYSVGQVQILVFIVSDIFISSTRQTYKYFALVSKDYIAKDLKEAFY